MPKPAPKYAEQEIRREQLSDGRVVTIVRSSHGTTETRLDGTPIEPEHASELLRTLRWK
jgi:hypothetical protein